MALGRAFDHQPPECPVVFRRPAGTQLVQRVRPVRLDGDAATGVAQQLGPEGGVLAQKRHGGRVIDAQARQQGLRGIVGTRDVGAEQIDALQVERLQLLFHR